MLRVTQILFALGTLAACGGGDGSSTDGGTTGTGTNSGTTAGTTGTSCVALTDGMWTADGAAFGMPMGVMVTMDSTACSFTLSDWDMVMGTVPEGGTVADDQVTLTGDAYWTTCHGTVTPAGDSVDGICDDDGAAWSLTLN